MWQAGETPLLGSLRGLKRGGKQVCAFEEPWSRHGQKEPGDGEESVDLINLCVAGGGGEVPAFLSFTS